MRLAFMGTPDFAVPSLEALVGAGHEIACVYTRPPRPAGRGQRERRSAVHERAAAHGIEVRTPVTLKQEREAFAALRADAAVVVAYGLILPQAILDAPRLGCINLHASLLPRWRGAAPIQRAVLAGDTETGVAAMRMEAGLDTGPILLERRVPVGPRSTAQELHDRLARLGAPLLVEALAGLDAGTLTPRPQAAEGVTYAPKIAPGEDRIDWRRPAQELDRLVRALGGWCEHEGGRIRVLAATPLEGSGEPGLVLDHFLAVACGAGALRLERLQRPGRAALPAPDFLRGYPLPPGSRLG